MLAGLLVELGLLLQLGFLLRLMFLHNVRHLLGELGSHLSAIPVHSGTPSASRTPTATRTPSLSRTKVAKKSSHYIPAYPNAPNDCLKTLRKDLSHLPVH